MTHCVHSERKQFFVTFAKTLRKNGFHTAALFLFMMIALNATNVSNHIEAVINDYPDVLQRTKYCISGSYFTGFEIAIACLIVGLSAVLLALYNFRFMHTKKTVNVYYSLGVRRSTLFAGKFSACVLSQLIGIALPFLVCGLYNVYLYGSSADLWKAIAFYGSSLTAVALYPFAVCVLCMIFSGSTIESLACGGLLTFLPSALYYGTYLFSELFLSGARFGVSTSVKAYAGGNIANEFGGRGAFIDFLYPVTEYQFGEALAKRYDVLWETGLPSAGYPILYLSLFVLVAVAARFAFSRQKTENAAFLCACPKMIAFTVFGLGSILIPAGVLIVREYGFDMIATVFSAFVLIGVAFGVFIGIVSVLLRSKEKIKAQLPLGGVMAGALLVFLFVFLTGGFGYEKRIPDTEKVTAAGITFNTSQGAIGYNSYYAYKGDNLDLYEEVDEYQQGENFLQTQLQTEGLWGDGAFVYFEEAQDIDTIRTIHSILMQDKRNTFNGNGHYGSVMISYKLKNGGQLSRVYNCISVEAMVQLQNLLTSETYMQACANEIVSYRERNLILFSKNCTAMTDVVLEEKDIAVQQALLQAIPEDIRNGRMPMDLHSEAAPIGYIAATYQTPEEGVRIKEPVYYISYSSEFLLIPVFPSMTETVAVLEKAQKLQYFEDIASPVSATVYANPLNDLSDEELFASHYQTMQFNGFVVEWGYYDDIETRGTILPLNAITVTDPVLLTQLAQESYLTYFVNDPGYFVDLHYTNADGAVTDALVYVPADKIPAILQ